MNFGMLRAVAMVLFALNILGCPADQTKLSPHPPIITDQSLCPAACANLRKYSCVEGQPIDMKHSCDIDDDCHNINQKCIASRCTTSCEQFCVDTENAGVWLMPQCLSTITSCSQINSCTTYKSSK